MPEPIVFPLDLNEVRDVWITRDLYGRLCGKSRLYSQSDIAELLEGLRRARTDIQSLVAEVEGLRAEVDHLVDVDAEATQWHDAYQQAKAKLTEAGAEIVALDGEPAEQHGEAATP
jgi:hypothetical protein